MLTSHFFVLSDDVIARMYKSLYAEALKAPASLSGVELLSSLTHTLTSIHSLYHH